MKHALPRPDLDCPREEADQWKVQVNKAVETVKRLDKACPELGELVSMQSTISEWSDALTKSAIDAPILAEAAGVDKKILNDLDGIESKTCEQLRAALEAALPSRYGICIQQAQEGPCQK